VKAANDVSGDNETTTEAMWSWSRVNAVETTVWTKTSIFRLSTLAVLMMLTLLGNGVVIFTIVSRAELRYKRVNVVMLNLAVGDLMVCFVTMATRTLQIVFGQWILGAVACKLVTFGQNVSLASTILLLAAMSIDRYQVSACVWRTL